jgi:hypothetical protein
MKAFFYIQGFRHRPEQKRVTWETPSGEAFVPLQEAVGVLASPRANAGMKRTSVVEHNLYFASWNKQAVET